ncbi:hypothetical protein GPALN_012435 [Globodera pallida]|nr:hypothetical protein GPALN_012435 [Globodera pallida]
MLCRRCAILALFFLALCACPEAQRTPPAEAEAAEEESGDANGAASYDAPALTVEREEALPKQQPPPLAHSDDDPPATVMHAHDTTTKTPPPHSSGSPPASSLQVLLILLALLSSMLTISRHQ